MFTAPTRLTWGGVALLIACIALLLRLLVPTLFWGMTSPVVALANVTAAQTHGFFSSFRDTTALALAHEQLMRENEALRAELLTLRAERADTGTLTGSGIRAGVVSRPPQSGYDVLVVRAGTRAGVTIGMGAFGPGGAPLGIVRAVTADYAQVELFSAPGLETPAWLGESTSITVRGDGAGALSATLSRSAGAQIGQTVSVAGPGRLALGVIARIDDDPSAPSIVAHLMPIVNPFSLAWIELRESGAFAPVAFPSASTTSPL